MDGADQNTGKHELFRAIIELIVTSNPDRREALGTTIKAYARDFPEDFHWAVGSTAPALLHHLLSAIEAGCRPPDLPPQAVQLVDRMPAANVRGQRDLQQGIGCTVRPAAPSQVRSVYGLPELW
jgi:hypothetical protein